MKADISASKFRYILAAEDNENVLRIWYCYEIGSTFVIYNSLEDALIINMLMCDKIAVATRLGHDAQAWEEMLDKRQNLQGQTFGNLIKLLSKHDLDAADLNYLKYIKEKRDVFIHRFFRGGEWPGDLDHEYLVVQIRRLLALQSIFQRAAARLPAIFGRSGLLIVEDLGENGFLIMNQSFVDGSLFEESEDAS